MKLTSRRRVASWSFACTRGYLPAICSWAKDLPEAYALYVKVGSARCRFVSSWRPMDREITHLFATRQKVYEVTSYSSSPGHFRVPMMCIIAFLQPGQVLVPHATTALLLFTPRPH